MSMFDYPKALIVKGAIKEIFHAECEEKSYMKRTDLTDQEWSVEECSIQCDPQIVGDCISCKLEETVIGDIMTFTTESQIKKVQHPEYGFCSSCGRSYFISRLNPPIN